MSGAATSADPMQLLKKREVMIPAMILAIVLILCFSSCFCTGQKNNRVGELEADASGTNSRRDLIDGEVIGASNRTVPPEVNAMVRLGNGITSVYY